MGRISNFYRSLPRRYRHYPWLAVLTASLVFLILNQYYSTKSNVDETVVAAAVVVPQRVANIFDLFDDDDVPLKCPSGSKFDISNRKHLAVFVSPTLVSYLWKNFRALLCTGIDAYIMLNEPFDIQSSVRGDGFAVRTNRSHRSYTHRFLYVSNELLDKYGVSYMTKYPQVQYAAWDRVIGWLYQRRNLKTAWVMDYRLQWLHVRNMTDFFDLFENDTSDILCAGLVPTNTHLWQNWPRAESDIFPKSYWLGTYSPVARWSRRLLLHHYQYMQIMHDKRLQYEIDKSFRFQEFIMATIANIEKLSVSDYNQKYKHARITLGDFKDDEILRFLRRGEHIIYPVKHESILTLNQTDEIFQMMKQMK